MITVWRTVRLETASVLIRNYVLVLITSSIWIVDEMFR